MRDDREAPQFLSGWKDIANYLGKGVRTVQRYERELGLPIRRPAGKQWGSVIATKAELDGWIAASPIREQFELARLTDDPYARSADDIKAGVAEMVRLRHQMQELRSEVRTAIMTLRNSLEDLQVGLLPNSKENNPPLKVATPGRASGKPVLITANITPRAS